MWDDLRVAWLFDEGTGDSVTDYSPDANNPGTIVGLGSHAEWTSEGLHIHNEGTTNFAGVHSPQREIFTKTGNDREFTILCIAQMHDDVSTQFDYQGLQIYKEGIGVNMNLLGYSTHENNDFIKRDYQFQELLDNMTTKYNPPGASAVINTGEAGESWTRRYDDSGTRKIKFKITNLDTLDIEESTQNDIASMSSSTWYAPDLVICSGYQNADFGAGNRVLGRANQGVMKALLVWERSLTDEEVQQIEDNDYPEPVPNPPTNVEATDGEYTDKIVVSWDSVADATSYKVYRSRTDDPETAILIDTLTNADPIESPYIDDTSAGAGLYYYYWVTALNDDGVSDYSASDRGWRQAIGPILSISGSKESNLSWTEAANHATTEIYKGLESGTYSLLDSGVIGFVYQDTDVEARTTYFYIVRSISTDGLPSLYSNEVNIRISKSGGDPSDPGYRPGGLSVWDTQHKYTFNRPKLPNEPFNRGAV